MGLGYILFNLFKREKGKRDEKDIKNEVLLDEQKKDESLESTDEDYPEFLLAPFGGEIYTETMGDLYMRQELHERAIRVFEKLLERDPENQSLQTKLGQAKTYLLSEKAGFQTKR